MKVSLSCSMMLIFVSKSANKDILLYSIRRRSCTIASTQVVVVMNKMREKNVAPSTNKHVSMHVGIKTSFLREANLSIVS